MRCDIGLFLSLLQVRKHLRWKKRKKEEKWVCTYALAKQTEFLAAVGRTLGTALTKWNGFCNR